MMNKTHRHSIRRGAIIGLAAALLGPLGLFSTAVLGLGAGTAYANTTVKINGPTVSPTSFAGSCPHVFTFRGAISVKGATTVKYHWVRSDHAIPPIQTLKFTGAGTKSVPAVTWKLGAPGWNHLHFWEKIQVLSPLPQVTSPAANFTLTCTPSPATSCTVGTPVSYAEFTLTNCTNPAATGGAGQESCGNPCGVYVFAWSGTGTTDIGYSGVTTISDAACPATESGYPLDIAATYPFTVEGGSGAALAGMPTGSTGTVSSCVYLGSQGLYFYPYPGTDWQVS
jgi:hypothetical protein